MTDQPPAYDPDNVFAKIVRGEMPCHEVYRDEHTLAFMDIMPRVDGHTLVIPKNPSRNILDAAPDDVARCAVTAQQIAKAVKAAFASDGVALWQFSEKASGQVVFHLHFHVLPRHEGVELRPVGQMADNDVLAEHAARLREALGSG
jgi:histidine triad (HIT) family protein